MAGLPLSRSETGPAGVKPVGLWTTLMEVRGEGRAAFASGPFQASPQPLGFVSCSSFPAQRRRALMCLQAGGMAESSFSGGAGKPNRTTQNSRGPEIRLEVQEINSNPDCFVFLHEHLRIASFFFCLFVLPNTS